MVVIDSFSIGYYICILIMVRFVVGRFKMRHGMILAISKIRANPNMRQGIVIAGLQDLCQAQYEIFKLVRFTMRLDAIVMPVTIYGILSVLYQFETEITPCNTRAISLWYIIRIFEHIILNMIRITINICILVIQ